MSALSPEGTARARFVERRAVSRDGLPEDGIDAEDFEASYLGWEIARCAPGLASDESRAIALLATASLIAARRGSTRLPLDDARLVLVLEPLGGVDALPVLRSIVKRARAGASGDPVVTVLGRAGERKPLLVDGNWLYLERMRLLEERFCDRVRARLGRAVPAREPRAIGRALAAIVAGPPSLTDEQRRAVREALAAKVALITGGPGTGKTTIVLALLRALAWMGEPMSRVAIAAPTGKAAQRLRDALAAGLASTSNDIADSALKTVAPVPQTLHRLLGWSPASGRFARHENDPLPHRLVVVDEASMVDLVIMDRLMRALADDARLVLLGDADQLPSVEAGAVFRDLCVSVPSVRLSANLRVGRDSVGRQLVAAARSVNGGRIDAQFEESVTTRRSVDDLAFEGVEHLAAPWSEVGESLLERWWSMRVASLDQFAGRLARTYRLKGGAFDPLDRAHLHALLDHHARSRLLCATRLGGMTTSAEAVNARLLGKLRGTSPQERRRLRPTALAAGAPVMLERNDYERQLFNGDQGVVVRVDSGGVDGPEYMAVFRQGSALQAFPVDAIAPLTPAWAMTVHKAQGSEFDEVVIVLPDVDLPLLTRELLYTAMTRARRAVLIVGAKELLARAVSRVIERHSGIAEKLAKFAK